MHEGTEHEGTEREGTEHEGTEPAVDQPEIIDLADATSLFSRNDQRAHRLFAVDESLRVREAPPA